MKDGQANSHESRSNPAEKSRPLSDLERLDVICDRFEQTWRSGCSIQIEKFLEEDDVDDEAFLEKLLSELIPLEIEFRVNAGQRVTFANYAERFPSHSGRLAREICRGDLAQFISPPPQRLAKYYLLHEIGRGSFGVVYLAFDPELDRFVALKRPLMVLDNAGSQRFRREARNAAKLVHPGIVAIISAEQDDDKHPYIVSEFADGETLEAYLKRGEEGQPSYRTAASLIAQIAEATDYAHSQGVIHRDLKPGNIILERRKIGDSTQDATPDDSLRPKILDFGLALQLDTMATNSMAGSIVGTPAYMSPEQARGEEVDHRSDVYSLGAILYELVFGQRPYGGDSYSAILLQVARDDTPVVPLRDKPVPHDLVTICLKCLNKKPIDRYGSAAELAEDLRRWLRDEPIIARPMGFVERTSRWTKRHRIAMVSLLAFLLIAVATAVTGYRLAESQIESAIAELELAPAHEIVDKLKSYRERSQGDRRLRKKLLRSFHEAAPARSLLRIASALGHHLDLDPSQEAEIVQMKSEINERSVEELVPLASYWREHPAPWTECLLNSLRADFVVRPDSPPSLQDAHALVLLAQLDPNWMHWKDWATEIVRHVVTDSDLSTIRAFKPIAPMLLDELKTQYKLLDTSQGHRQRIIDIVNEYFDEPEVQVWFVEHASGPEVYSLVDKLVAEPVLPEIKIRILHLVYGHIKDFRSDMVYPREVIDVRTAWSNLALGGLAITGSESAETRLWLRHLLVSNADPSNRHEFVSRLDWFLSPPQIMDAVKILSTSREVEDTNILFAILLGIGLDSRSEMRDYIQQSDFNFELMFREQPDSGIHSAIHYALQKMGLGAEVQGWIDRISADPTYHKFDDREWSYTPFGCCMVRFDAGTYRVLDKDVINSNPVKEVVNISGRAEPEEGLSNLVIDRPFAISAWEVTTQQIAEFTKLDDRQIQREVNLPLLDKTDVPGPTWVEACNWAASKFGKEDDQVYDLPVRVDEQRNLWIASHVERPGIRLPQLNETLVAFAGGALTPTPYFNRAGDVVLDADLLGVQHPNEYPSQYELFQDCPNRRGIFGMFLGQQEVTSTWFPTQTQGDFPISDLGHGRTYMSVGTAVRPVNSDLRFSKLSQLLFSGTTGGMSQTASARFAYSYPQ